MRLGLACVLLAVTFSAVVIPRPAAAVAGSRYWVGGTGNWSDNVNHWSASSGGGPGASLPNSNYNCIFDASSGVGTLTFDTDGTCMDIVATGAALSSINLGTRTWHVYGNITGWTFPLFAVNTGTLDLAGTSTQTLGPQTSLLIVNTVKISGAGRKNVNLLLEPRGSTMWTQTVTNVEMYMGTGTTAQVAFIPYTSKSWFAGTGNVLTVRSQNSPTQWNFEPQAGPMVLQGIDVKDALCTGGCGVTIFATDTTNTDSGHNTVTPSGAWIFTPKTSVIDPAYASSFDYGPQVVRNAVGTILVLYGSGGVNNGSLIARTSTDNGLTWSASTLLMTPSGVGTGIVDSIRGAGAEIWMVVDKNDWLYLVGHKLLSGATHVYFTKINITSMSAISTYTNWLSASGTPAPSQGHAVNGQGYDDLGAYIDPSVTVTPSGNIYVGVSGNGATAYVKKWTGSVWTAISLDFSGPNPPAMVDVLSDNLGDLHLLTSITVSARMQIVYKGCAHTLDCTVTANWTSANGTGKYDYVASQAGGSMSSFPHPDIDSNGDVQVVAGSSYLISGFYRIFHNSRLHGTTNWTNGNALNGAGTQVTGATLSDPSRFSITVDDGGNTYVVALAASVGTIYHKWNGTSWSTSPVYLQGNKVNVAGLHPRGGVGYLDVLADATNAASNIQAIQFQAIPVTPGVAWWDTPPTVSITATPTLGYSPMTVAFTSSPRYGVPPYNYTWSFGDGTFGYARNLTHVYSAGDFTANLTLTDAMSEVATNSTNITVRAPVTAIGTASVTSGTYPLAVNFTATQTGGYAPYTYLWNFGDGTTSTAQNVTHTYTTYGFYLVTLRVTDTYGSVGTATVHITVHPPDNVLWSGFLILLILFLVFMGIGMVIHSPIWVLLSSFFGIFAALALALNLALFPYALVVVLLMFGFSLLTMIGSAFAMIGGGGGGL